MVPTSYDCNVVSGACTYQSSNRPTSYALYDVTIHDIEGTAQDAISTFQDINSGVSVHYVIDSDGTVYQVVREKDIAYHAGNFWYNEHAVGIEHAGIDATGYQWYNATEYLASAKLVAYLLNKYNIPLDHAHITAHGTTPVADHRHLAEPRRPGQVLAVGLLLRPDPLPGRPYPTGNTPAAGLFRVNPEQRPEAAGRERDRDRSQQQFLHSITGPSTKDAVIPGAPGSDPTTRPPTSRPRCRTTTWPPSPTRPAPG